MRPEEIRALRIAVERGDTSVGDALSRMIEARRGGRLWRSEPWAALRKRLLGSSCEQCAGTEPPFTLQHLRQPRRFGDVLRELRSEHDHRAWEAWKADHPLELLDEERDVCPKCGSTALTRRTRATPRYLCNGAVKRRRCRHAFEVAERRVVPARKANATLNRDNWERFRATCARDYAATTAALERRAVIVCLREFEDYMNGLDTATFCKRCAFMWDEKGLRLCAGCKSQWHDLHRLECAACGRSPREPVDGP